jgi:cytidylate kinase
VPAHVACHVPEGLIDPMPVITVARQYGSLGDEIAAAVAERLSLRLVGQDILTEVAQRLGVPEATLSEHDERDTGMVGDLVRTMRRLYPATVAPAQEAQDAAVDEAAYLQLTRQVIWEVARGNDAVVVGRGATFVLQSNPDILHVLLVAPFETRVERVMATEHLTKQQAAQRVRSADSSRARYLKHYYRADWLDVSHYDLVLNTAHFSEVASTHLICSAAAPST